MSRIIHINSSSSGGAFSFSKVLHDRLVVNGFDSAIITKYFEKRDDKIFKYSMMGNISILRFLKKVFCLDSLKQDLKYEIFTPPLKKSSVLRKQIVKNAEIIHLHWVADFVSTAEIVEMTKRKKVLWTLHDMNPFTGGCHHSDDCEQYLAGCENCPQLGQDGKKVKEYFDIKRNSFNKIDSTDLTIISPSQWMFEKASKSRLLEKFKHICIPHFVDTERIKYIEKNMARTLLNLPQNKTIFLYVSAVLENKRKGFNKVVELIRKYEEKDDLLFILVGNTKDIFKYENIKNLRIVGNIADVHLLANYYSASDFLLNFTVAESFGLTTVEALCCGTPVICYNIPVMKEHIENNVNGLFVDENSMDMINCNNVFNRKNISEKAVWKYGMHNFEKYLELYKR